MTESLPFSKQFQGFFFVVFRQHVPSIREISSDLVCFVFVFFLVCDAGEASSTSESSSESEEGERTPEGRAGKANGKHRSTPGSDVEEADGDEDEPHLKRFKSEETMAADERGAAAAAAPAGQELEATPTPSPVERPVEELPPYLPAIMGCRSVEEFQCLNK